MVAVTAAAVSTPIVASIAARPRLLAAASATSVLGLPQIRVRGGNVRCSSEKKVGSITGVSKPLMAAMVSMVGATGPALALVDERLSTEGTGLSLGLSNNLLGWILLGVFGLIWALYFSYTSTLEEDEESGLSL